MDSGIGGARGTYTVNWGGGTSSTDVRDDQSDTYASARNCTVRASGDFTGLFLVDGNSNNIKTLSDIDQWGSDQRPFMESVFGAARGVEE